MTPRSPTATEAARRLWARDGKVTAPEGIAAEVERVCLQLDAGLTRWIGQEGYRVLLERALGTARVEHPALANVACRGGDEAAVMAAVRSHGAAYVTEGMVALLAILIEQLGRVIGEEMVVHLLEQTETPGRRGAPGTEG